MLSIDDQLQNQLELIDKDNNLGDALSEQPTSPTELVPLVQLASQIREAHHPQPSPLATRATEVRLMQAANQIAEQANQPRRFPWLPRWPLSPALAGGLGLAMIAVFLFAAVLIITIPRQANAATLRDLIGTVEITDSDGNWRPASESTRIRTGQSIRTQEGASATLVFSDGTRTMLAPETELSITLLDSSRGGSLQVKLSQVLGTTQHNVIPFHGKRNLFEVHTPSGVASVLGTDFNISVTETGQAFYSVERGLVLVQSTTTFLDLNAGQATSTKGDQPPQAPAYTFSIEDTLTAINDETWLVGDVPITITDSTYITGDFKPGDLVHITGRIFAGEWIADLVQSPYSYDYKYIFTGVISAMEDDQWTINGVQVLVNEVTELKGEFKVGDAVRVEYVILEGNRWLALEIEHLDNDDDDDNEITPTATSTTNGSVPTPLPTLVNCTGADPHPAGEKLSQRFGVSYEEIMGWFCQRFGFGEIDLAYSLSKATGIPVAEIFDLRRSGMGWGNIKRYVYTMPTPTPTPTVTATATLTTTATISTTVPITGTLTVTPTLTSTPTPSDGQYCTGNGPNHPTGNRLALRYNVPYDEIMGWFCQGFGFGEIDRAYSLGQQTGVPVDEIFALRRAGYGWGEIKAQLTSSSEDDKEDKDKKPKKTKEP